VIRFHFPIFPVCRTFYILHNDWDMKLTTSSFLFH
jgi:hypothetical protein